jgi:hypothetical protein
MSDEDQVTESAGQTPEAPEAVTGNDETLTETPVPAPDDVSAQAPAPDEMPIPAPDQTPVPDVTSSGAEAGGTPRSRTGLWVAIGAIVVIVIAVGLGLMWMRGALPGGASSSSGARAKVTAALGFVEAILDGDTMAIKPFLTDDAQNAATADEWAEIASSDTTGLVTFSNPVWTGDTKASVALDAQGTTGTIVFTYDEVRPLDVTMLATAGGTTETDTVTLVAAGSAWRVIQIANGTNKTVFNATMIKSLIPTGTAQ